MAKHFKDFRSWTSQRSGRARKTLRGESNLLSTRSKNRRGDFSSQNWGRCWWRAPMLRARNWIQMCLRWTPAWLRKRPRRHEDQRTNNHLEEPNAHWRSFRSCERSQGVWGFPTQAEDPWRLKADVYCQLQVWRAKRGQPRDRRQHSWWQATKVPSEGKSYRAWYYHRGAQHRFLGRHDWRLEGIAFDDS